MVSLIISILALIFFVMVIVLNLDNTADLSLVFVTLDGVPSIILVLIGIAFGLTIAVPITFNIAKAYSKRILEKSIHIEAKRMKQEEKRSKTKAKNNKAKQLSMNEKKDINSNG